MLWQAAYAQAAELAQPEPCGVAGAPCSQQPAAAEQTEAAAGHTGDCDSLRPLRQGLPPLAVGKAQGSCCRLPSSAAGGSGGEAWEACTCTPGTRSAHLSSARSAHSMCEWREECWQAELEDSWAEAVEEVA